MLTPDAGRVVRCVRCGLDVDSRVARYLWVKSGWRGRAAGLPSSKRPDERQAVLCGPCGDDYREAMRAFFLRSGSMELARGVVYDGSN